MQQQLTLNDSSTDFIELADRVEEEISLDDFMQDINSAAKVDAETLKFNSEKIADTTTIESNETNSSNSAAFETNFNPVTNNTIQEEKLTPERAKAQTAMFLKGRDMLQQRALAFLAKQPNEYKKFALESHEFDWLLDVYAEYVGILGNIPPWLNIIIAELCIMIPKITMSWNMRKEVELIEEQRQTILAQKRRIDDLENNNTSHKVSNRPDTKGAWTIDEKGFFINRPNGKYIPKDERKERANLNDLDMLNKHNTEAFVNEVFKLDK